MNLNSYQVIFRALDTLRAIHFDCLKSDWRESSESEERNVIPQNRRDKLFVRMGDIVGISERWTSEYPYCLISKNNKQFEDDFSSATIQPTDDGKPDLKVASRKEVAYGNL